MLNIKKYIGIGLFGLIILTASLMFLLKKNNIELETIYKSNHYDYIRAIQVNENNQKLYYSFLAENNLGDKKRHNNKQIIQNGSQIRTGIGNIIDLKFCSGKNSFFYIINEYESYSKKRENKLYKDGKEINRDSLNLKKVFCRQNKNDLILSVEEDNNLNLLKAEVLDGDLYYEDVLVSEYDAFSDIIFSSDGKKYTVLAYNYYDSFKLIPKKKVLAINGEARSQVGVIEEIQYCPDSYDVIYIGSDDEGKKVIFKNYIKNSGGYEEISNLQCYDKQGNYSFVGRKDDSYEIIYNQETIYKIPKTAKNIQVQSGGKNVIYTKRDWNKVYLYKNNQKISQGYEDIFYVKGFFEINKLIMIIKKDNKKQVIIKRINLN